MAKNETNVSSEFPDDMHVLKVNWIWWRSCELYIAHMFGSTVTGRRVHGPEDLYWVLRSLKHHLRAQRQGHYIIDLPEEALDDLP